MTMVWPALKKGRWQFQVKVGGANSAFVGYRTFVVQAY
jgi:hypothetical protein